MDERPPLSLHPQEDIPCDDKKNCGPPVPVRSARLPPADAGGSAGQRDNSGGRVLRHDAFHPAGPPFAQPRTALAKPPNGDFPERKAIARPALELSRCSCGHCACGAPDTWLLRRAPTPFAIFGASTRGRHRRRSFSNTLRPAQTHSRLVVGNAGRSVVFRMNKAADMRRLRRYRPYVRRARGDEKTDSSRCAFRMAFLAMAYGPTGFYVMVQRGLPRIVVDCGRTKRAVERAPLPVASKRQTFRKWASRVARKARGR